jgi:hypothetical protein
MTPPKANKIILRVSKTILVKRFKPVSRLAVKRFEENRTFLAYEYQI